MLTLNEIVEWNLTGEQIKQLRQSYKTKTCRCNAHCCRPTEDKEGGETKK